MLAGPTDKRWEPRWPRKVPCPISRPRSKSSRKSRKRWKSGDQSLEEALASFQRGIELTRACQKGLQEAEQRVEKLIRENDTWSTEPLSPVRNGRIEVSSRCRTYSYI